MNRRLSLAILFVFFISSCGNDNIPATPASTRGSTTSPTITPSSNKTPEATASAVPTEAGPKDGDRYTVTENGHTYEYVYNAELGTGVRTLMYNASLMDTPYQNYFLMTVLIADNVLGEESAVKITHADVKADQDPSPFKKIFSPMVQGRYFNKDPLVVTSDEYESLQKEMMKGLESKAFLPIILSTGDENNVSQFRLSNATGIILTIMSLETIKELGGDRVSTGYVEGVTYYAEIYGVDENNNALCRLAFEGSMNDLSDEALRKAIFLFPANIAENMDLRKIGQTDFSKRLAVRSTELRADGSQDFTIERVTVPAQTPTPTPTP